VQEIVPFQFVARIPRRCAPYLAIFLLPGSSTGKRTRPSCLAAALLARYREATSPSSRPGAPHEPTCQKHFRAVRNGLADKAGRAVDRCLSTKYIEYDRQGRMMSLVQTARRIARDGAVTIRRQWSDTDAPLWNELDSRRHQGRGKRGRGRAHARIGAGASSNHGFHNEH